MLYNPRRPWHAAVELGATVEAPIQYWRPPPHEHKNLFGDIVNGGQRGALYTGVASATPDWMHSSNAVTGAHFSRFFFLDVGLILLDISKLISAGDMQ